MLDIVSNVHSVANIVSQIHWYSNNSPSNHRSLVLSKVGYNTDGQTTGFCENGLPRNHSFNSTPNSRNYHSAGSFAGRLIFSHKLSAVSPNFKTLQWSMTTGATTKTKHKPFLMSIVSTRSGIVITVVRSKMKFDSSLLKSILVRRQASIQWVIPFSA